MVWTQTTKLRRGGERALSTNQLQTLPFAYQIKLFLSVLSLTRHHHDSCMKTTETNVYTSRSNIIREKRNKASSNKNILHMKNWPQKTND